MLMHDPSILLNSNGSYFAKELKKNNFDNLPAQTEWNSREKYLLQGTKEDNNWLKGKAESKSNYPGR